MSYTLLSTSTLTNSWLKPPNNYGTTWNITTLMLHRLKEVLTSNHIFLIKYKGHAHAYRETENKCQWDTLGWPWKWRKTLSKIKENVNQYFKSIDLKTILRYFLYKKKNQLIILIFFYIFLEIILKFY